MFCTILKITDFTVKTINLKELITGIIQAGKQNYFSEYGTRIIANYLPQIIYVKNY